MGVFDTAGEMQAIKACADANGDDFVMRVFRQDTMTSSQQEMAATFLGARADHFVTPEVWIPPMLGGGYYRLIAIHASDPTKVVGTITVTSIPGPRKVPPDLSVVARDDWQGPKILKYPKIETQQAAAAMSPFVGAPGSGAAPTGGADARGQFPGSGAGASTEVMAHLGLLDQQRRYDAERLTQMIEAQGKATERSITAVLEVVKSQARQPLPPPLPPEKPIAEQIVPLIAALTPLVVAFRQSGAEDRKAQLDREQRREDRAATDRAESAKALAALSDRASSASGDMLKVVSPMVDAVAQMSRTMLQNAALVREFTAGEAPQEEGLTGIFKAALPALGEWLTMKEQAKIAALSVRAGQAPPPQLPPRARNGVTVPGVTPPPAVEPDTDDPTADAPDSAPNLAAIAAPELLADIETAIKGHHDVASLAGGYLDALQQNVGVRDEVNKAGGTIQFFQARLGTPWIMDPKPGADGVLNSAYLRTLVAALTGVAQQRGITT